jgi:hypothetical protein
MAVAILYTVVFFVPILVTVAGNLATVRAAA